MSDKIEIEYLNNYFIDLCQYVFNNELILSKIFKHLVLKDVSKCGEVCTKWRMEAKRIGHNTSESLFMYHLFKGERRADMSADDSDPNGKADDEMEYCSRVHWVDKYDFKSNFIKSVTNELYSIPEVCLIVYGSFGEDVKLNQRLEHLEIIRKSLPQNNCQILNLNSTSCLIGCPTTSSVPVDKITHFGDLAAVSLLLLPKYREGIDITIFTGANMREKIFNLSNIKSILLFTTSSVFQDNRELYKDMITLSTFIANNNSRIAFGGYNSAYFSFNKKDLNNYLTTNGENNNELESRDMFGICFSGENVKSCSLLLNTKRVTKTQQKLREFKNNLGFEANNNKYYETIAFMFTDEEKNEAFAKLHIFRSIFVGCNVLGISGYGQYGYSYWPTLETNTVETNKPKPFSVNYLLPNPKPKRKPKRRIVLNTNMTTFVVIKLPKRFTD